MISLWIWVNINFENNLTFSNILSDFKKEFLKEHFFFHDQNNVNSNIIFQSFGGKICNPAYLSVNTCKYLAANKK